MNLYETLICSLEYCPTMKTLTVNTQHDGWITL
jgi:hypothetical protein